MTYDTMFAKVSGTTSEGIKFTEKLTFHLIPPEKGVTEYGTGYYMRVTGEGLPWGKQLEDVRYAKTTDIEILADRWIASWYGENAEEVIKQFPVEGQTEYTVAAEEIKEYRLVSLDSGENIYTTDTEEAAVKTFCLFSKQGQRLEIQKVIRLIIDVDE